MLLLGIIFYVSSLVFGALLSDYFFSEYVDQRVIRFAMGVPMGFAFAAYLTLLLEIFAGSFNEWLMALSSLIMLAVSFYLCLPLLKGGKSEHIAKNYYRELKKELKEYRILYCGIFLVSFVLIFMQYHSLQAASNGIIGTDNYGVDYLFHLGIGNSLVYGSFPASFPYAAGAINVYPFITDFYSAMLVYTGLGLVIPFYLMNFLLYFSIVAVGSYFFYRLSMNQFIPTLAIIIFLFCGEGLGLVVMSLFNSPIFQLPNSTFSLLQSNPLFLITYPYFNFTMPVENNFAPQHEFLLAFPYALTILLILYLAFIGESARAQRKLPYLFLGLLIGLLPLIHPETFVFLLVFGFVLFLYIAFSRRGEQRRSTLMQLIKLGALAALISLIEIMFIHSQPISSGIITQAITNPIWYSGGASIPSLMLMHLIFWPEVFGSILVVGISGMFLLKRKQLILFVPSLIIFLIINLVWFPPGFGDSNKYTVYMVFFLAFASAIFLSRLFNSKRELFKIFAILIFVSIIFSCVIAEYRSDTIAVYNIADNISLSASSWLINNTSSGALFVTNCYRGTFDYLPTIAARRTLLDMELYTIPVGIYNYNINNVASNIDDLMQNPNCNVIKEYNISYVVVDKLNYLLGPESCAPVNYSTMRNSPNLTVAAYFSDQSTTENITVFKTHCGS